MLRGPRAVPTLPRSSLTPGCREPAQFHHDPPGSFGTCMWYRCPTPNRKHKAEAGVGCQPPQEKQAGCHLGTGPGLQTRLAKGINGLPRVRLKLMRHRPAAGIRCSSSASLCLCQHNTLRQRSSSQAPALALPTPSQASSGTAQLPLPLQRLFP